MSVTSSVLGRGLGSLLPTPGARADKDGTPLYVRVERIRVRAEQPRQHFDEQGIRQLAVSIREQGILQPLVVTAEEHDYLLIAGERRLRAAKFAGLREVPVVVRAADATEAFELALIENIQRQDLNPIEEAEAFSRLIDEHAYTQEALARRVGKDRTTITNALRLLKLRTPLRERLLRGAMSAGHARALLGCNDDAYQDELAERIEVDGLSVRAVERLVSARRKPEAKKKPHADTTLHTQLSSRLTEQLGGRKIAIKPTRRGGMVTIRYTNADDLQALVDQLAGAS